MFALPWGLVLEEKNIASNHSNLDLDLVFTE